MHELTPFEIEVMHFFWESGDLTAPQVHERVGEHRPVAYTTVKTIIDRLEQKGALKRIKSFGRTILYRAAIQRGSTAKRHLRRFMETVFRGNSRELFTTLLHDEQLTMDDLSYLETVLRQKRSDLEGDGDD